MFRGRSKLQRRDQESGLVFSWRVPLTSTASFVVAVMLIGLISAGLAALVRVRVGEESAQPDQRASLVLVSEGEGGGRLDALAVEAGPYPFRWNPAADPSYAAMRNQALREASGAVIPYSPKLVPIEMGKGEFEDELNKDTAFLPPLPAKPQRENNDQPKETTLGVRVLRSGAGPGLQLPRLPLKAKDAVAASGRRFLIWYEEDGRVSEVISLGSEDTPVDLVGWLRRARVLDHEEKSGWMAVESSVEP